MAVAMAVHSVARMVAPLAGPKAVLMADKLAGRTAASWAAWSVVRLVALTVDTTVVHLAARSVAW